VAALLAAAVAAPSPAELAGQEAALAELRTVTRARRAIPRATGGRRRLVGLLAAGPGAVNEDRCRASKVGKGADRSKKPKAVTSQAPVEAAGDADRCTGT
jgi:hypothetical protein